MMASIAGHSFNMFPRPMGPDSDFIVFPDPQTQSRAGYTSPTMDVQYSPDGYGYSHDYENGHSFPENSQLRYNGRLSPVAHPDEPSSNMSTTSAPSASSSTVGSPSSNPGQLAFMPEYNQTGLGVNPSIVGHGDYFAGTEYSFVPNGIEEYNLPYENKSGPGYVDPSLIHPEIRGPMGPPISGYDNSFSPQNQYPHSPALSGERSPAPIIRNGSVSPYVGYHFGPYPVTQQNDRRQSHSSFHSQEFPFSGDEVKEKQRCPHPECGKIFKDLKAHMLTHLNERPEKCPIQTCDYHVKGFARKYDKNRHTLTHYKGTMVCGFCPGSGSAAEKSFNRADVFKRHLTAVHGVEQTPPNSRKKSPTTNNGKKLTGYAPDATGRCSTCSATFANAQDFYEHLDDCVLRIVQQEDPAEAVNAQRLAEVEQDKDVHNTLEKNNLPLTTVTISTPEEDDNDMGEDEIDEDPTFRKATSPAAKRKGNPANGVQKPRGMTHSRGGVSAPISKARKNRRDYPASWGYDKGQMTMKKRVMTVFDGPRRLAKDDMMLSTEHEVRIKLEGTHSYVTDLDINTMKRAQGFLNASEDEKGHWVSDDPTEDEFRKMVVLSQ